MAEDLNLAQPRTNPASGQSRSQTQELLVANPMHWPLRYSAKNAYKIFQPPSAGQKRAVNGDINFVYLALSLNPLSPNIQLQIL